MSFDERHISHNIREIEDLKKELQKTQASAYTNARNSVKKTDVKRLSEEVFREVADVLCTRNQIRENEIRLKYIERAIENSRDFLKRCFHIIKREAVNYKEDSKLNEQERRIKHTHVLVAKQLDEILGSFLWDIPKDNT